MTTNFDDVGEFHEKFGLRRVGEPGPHDMSLFDFAKLMEFRIKFLHEEYTEFLEGYDNDNHAQMADALIDLVYVAMGTAHLLGYPWQPLWDEVQRVNMQKERAASDGSNSSRGSSFDVVKPPGWTPPRIEQILAQHGFELPSFDPDPGSVEYTTDPIQDELESGFSMHDYGDR